jgi:hypothetical protein
VRHHTVILIDEDDGLKENEGEGKSKRKKKKISIDY